MSDHVRCYADSRGTSHLVAVWTHEEDPDTENEEAYIWFVASQVQYVGVNQRTGKTEIVFASTGNSLETDAAPTDVRWAIDYALNGGRERGFKGVYTDRPSPDPT